MSIAINTSFLNAYSVNHSTICSAQGMASFIPFYPSPFYTCTVTKLPSIFSKVEIASYNAITFTPDVPRSKFEITAREIKPEHNWKFSDWFGHFEIMKKRNENEKNITQRYELYGKAAREYLKKTRLPLPAADRAILLNQAQNALKEQIADFGYYHSEESQIKSQIEELRFQEASACFEAAEETENPYGKFAFLQKGVMQLPDLPRDEYEPKTYHKYKDPYIKQCVIAEEIWSSLSKLALTETFNFQNVTQNFPYELSHMWKPVNGHYSKEFFVGQCFLNAARVTRDLAFALDDSHEHLFKRAHLYFTKARDQLKDVSALLEVVLKGDEKKLVLSHVEEQISLACHGRWHMQDCQGKKTSTEEFVEQAKRTANRLSQLAEKQDIYARAYTLLKQSIILDSAARHCPNAKESFKLSEKAHEVGVEALRLNPQICLVNRLCQPYYLETLKDRLIKARDIYIKGVIKERQRQKKNEGMICRIKFFIAKVF